MMWCIAIKIVVFVSNLYTNMREQRWSIIFWGNPLQNYVLAISAFLILVILFRALQKYVFVWGNNIIKHYKSHKSLYAIAHTLLDVPWYIFAVISVYIALQLLHIEETIAAVIRVLFIVLIVFRSSSILSSFFTLLITKLIWSKDTRSSDMTRNIVRLTVKIVIWITALLLVLTNLGIEITPLLASLWVWGIAIAFALQNILQDFFSSFSLFVEKPFSIWDFVMVGDVKWTVKHISFRSSYILALEWQMIIIPNKEIMNAKIENYGTMKRRWNKQTIWVVYETALDKLQKVPLIIQEEIDKIPDITYHRAHIKELNAYSIDVEFAYYIESKEFVFFLDKNQELLMSILARFAEEWISIAYPTQLVYTHPKK